MSTEAHGRLVDALRSIDRGLLLVVTGAGVSAASGIATFRGPEPDAIWKEADVSLATAETFRRDPVRQWRWYLERFRALDGARPNAAHGALVRLEAWHEARGGRFLLVTQNIDGLHAAAGQRRLIEVHGTAARLRCSRSGCRFGTPEGSLPRGDFDLEAFRADPDLERLPVCPQCGSLLRAHVLFFDELYDEHRDYRFDEVCDAARLAAAVLFVGTSFAVGVTDLVLRLAGARGVPMASVDPTARRAPASGVEPVPLAAEELLPELVRLLERS